uniref:Secreted protein n=1 Tax=Anopheles dirus TaxID=7168 RepID=A0A182NMC8_9DIPT
MASTWIHRGMTGRIVLSVLCWTTCWWTSVLAAPFYFPVDGYQPQYYYGNRDQWIQPTTNGYNYPQPNAVAPATASESQNVAVYSGNANYYGVPGYEDQRYVGSRNSWSDPYLRWKWNNYYNGYYYPYSSGSGWKDRQDGAYYYSKRRQDSVQPTEATTPAITTTTQRQRKKKLFVPNVWG